MNIGGRDYVGAASFLSGVARAGQTATSQQGVDGQEAPNPVMTAETLLDHLGTVSVANMAALATALGQTPDTIMPHISKLIALGFVAAEGEGPGAGFVLTDLGRRALKIAQVTQSGS